MSNAQRNIQAENGETQSQTSDGIDTNTDTDAEFTEDVEAGMNETTIIGGPPNLFRQQSDYEIKDLVTEYDPKAVFITGTESTIRGIKQVKYSMPVDIPVLYAGGVETGQQRVLSFDGVSIVTCSEMSDVSQLAALEANGEIDSDDAVIVLSNLLSISVEMETLDTVMDGIDAYKNAFPREELSADYTHVSGDIESGYCRDWGGMTIYGAGLGVDGSQQRREFLSLTLSDDGVLLDETIDSSNIGLKAIENVGPKTADRLREAGYERRQEVAECGFDELRSIEGLGEATAERIKKSATALSDGEVVPVDESAVPGDDPVFIDIETDGLNPTAVWLIGVMDGVDGNHMSFIETDNPGSGEAIEEFMLWFKANAADRTIMAWNGWNFDFPVLRKHIQEHCPQYADVWKHASKRDPLRWARDLENAVLPGRTNKLEHVAEGLGWKGHKTGLSGKEVARRYRAWLEEQSPENELDWEMHKQYCSDDVKALAYIYQAMDDASRLAGDVTNNRDIEEETSQGGLFDNY